MIQAIINFHKITILKSDVEPRDSVPVLNVVLVFLAHSACEF
ncbi:conserved hypothetical protein [Treponema phagedenis]|uniref:Uncharacterized protein n=1 Tax=Treponema phagedenis TaxID=162 RepID=A0A0B7GR31_TREPH|nr:conserved hypothetical protein [Treponema phagedenis]